MNIMLIFIKGLIKNMGFIMEEKEYITREIEPLCLDRMKTGLITAIIGARQVGKTTMLMKLKEIVSAKGIVPEERIFYYSLDDPILRAELNKDFRFIEKEIEKLTGESLLKLKNPIFLIIDEAQKSPVIFDWLKIIYDTYSKEIKIIISGSSALEVKGKSTESLSGRITFLKLHPLILRELVCQLTNVTLPDPLWRSLPQKK